jgi:hypothetical protein
MTSTKRLIIGNKLKDKVFSITGVEGAEVVLLSQR